MVCLKTNQAGAVGKCTIEIEPGTEIVNKRPYQLPSHIKEAVAEEIRKLQSNGIIMESNSDWCSPLVPVKKPDGSVRLCVDFRALNAATPIKKVLATKSAGNFGEGREL